MKVVVYAPPPKAALPVMYPRLRVDRVDGTIVLFWDETSGIVVGKTDGSQPVGRRSDRWVTDAFLDFDGSVTLSNT
jgi:hypothetical protein